MISIYHKAAENLLQQWKS